jgi:hypothetical protein
MRAMLEQSMGVLFRTDESEQVRLRASDQVQSPFLALTGVLSAGGKGILRPEHETESCK